MLGIATLISSLLQASALVSSRHTEVNEKRAPPWSDYLKCEAKF